MAARVDNEFKKIRPSLKLWLAAAGASAFVMATIQSRKSDGREKMSEEPPCQPRQNPPP
jgi:hypothetical protein